VAEGNVGGGTGMTAYGFAGGIGTASRRLQEELGGWTVGALVQANFGRRQNLTIGGAPVGRELPTEPTDARSVAEERAERDRGSVIVVLATDAPLDARQLGRLARRAAFGLARTGTYSGHGSGDLAIAFSTAERIPLRSAEPVRTVRVMAEESRALDGLFLAAVESVEEAVINALFRARTMVGRDGHRREALPLEPTLEILRRHGVIRAP
jgi:D-aminopeptidase